MPSRSVRLFRALWPWFVGVAIVVIVATRVPLSAFSDAIQEGPHLPLAAVNLLIGVTVLCSDTFSTWVGLNVLGIRRPLVDVLLVRGATYVLFVINYAVGQGGFGVYLHKTGTKALRAASAMLFLMGTNLATLLVITALAWLVHGFQARNELMAGSIVAGNIAFLIYLVVIASAPAFLARRQLLSTLFEAGVRGHVMAMLGRLPHTIVIVLGQWVALRTWGISVPFSVGITLMPAVVLVASLPISPAGLGTTQAAMVFFFSNYAAGATAADRSASVLAFGIVHFVYGVLGTLLVGLLCVVWTKRRGLSTES